MSENIPLKVVEYEKFLNETLRSDLRKILEARDKIYSQTAEYLQLKNVIERMKETDLSQDELKTKVDLGCNFYCQANVPDVSKIFVCVGFGFYVEFTLEEALRFIEKKTARLTEEANNLTKDASKVKANINIILEGLKEMQHLDMTTKMEQRDIWN
ncbi:hypothetical protein CHS0354_038432 [Potamilus streckersoni]|uniref:Protein UXT n=1 Tax=Potamilus streckersoni TaxID=2493646 RepID=A0AAE0S5W4_9BIVA|nr:hypothetical protein CHS0354_038432 [Potamilus streckersoni]